MVLANKKDLPNSMTIREVQRPALPTNNLTSSTADANNDAQRNNPRLNELKEKIQQMEMLPPVLLTILFPLSQISKQLDLPSYTNRLWEIQACSALKGLGLQQAFMSVNKLIKKSWEEEGRKGKKDWSSKLKKLWVFNSTKMVTWHLTDPDFFVTQSWENVWNWLKFSDDQSLVQCLSQCQHQQPSCDHVIMWCWLIGGQLIDNVIIFVYFLFTSPSRLSVCSLLRQNQDWTSSRTGTRTQIPLKKTR